jgi:hypothetical protein
MPHHSQLAEAPSTTSYGQVIEYIAGKPPLQRNTGSVARSVFTGCAVLQSSAIEVSG